MSGMLLDGSSSQKDGSSESGSSKSHFLSISYYQRFFDVDEETVCKIYLTRLICFWKSFWGIVIIIKILSNN